MTSSLTLIVFLILPLHNRHHIAQKNKVTVLSKQSCTRTSYMFCLQLHYNKPTLCRRIDEQANKCVLGDEGRQIWW